MAPAAKVKIMAICGSLSRTSYNRAALRALIKVAPPRFAIEEWFLDGIPILNDDERERRPQAVQDFCAQIVAADGVIIATPEYLYSVSGVLKNAIDWTGGKDSAFQGKPVGILSAAQNAYGGMRAQYDLRKVLQAARALVMPGPEVFIGGCRSKFDSNGDLTDDATRAELLAFVDAFGQWIERLWR
jgi:chromate reductase